MGGGGIEPLEGRVKGLVFPTTQHGESFHAAVRDGGLQDGFGGTHYDLPAALEHSTDVGRCGGIHAAASFAPLRVLAGGTSKCERSALRIHDQ